MKKSILILVALVFSACAGSNQGANMEAKKEMKQGNCDGSCCPHKCTRNNQ
jgi:hypothetical protein